MDIDKSESVETISARRSFLARCGKFALVTPPAMTVLLSSTAQNYAVASSGRHGGSWRGNNGFGNGGDDGVPGRSGDNRSPRASEKEADDDR
jgi:hypothetical protein